MFSSKFAIGMAKPRILIYMHYLEVGGAERALLGLLHALDPGKVDVDLFLNQHTGDFMPLIPPHVNLLPQLPEYSAIERPIRDIICEGHISIAIRRLISKLRHKRYFRTLPADSRANDESIYQYVFRQVSPALRDLTYLGDYDLAISFMHPHNIVRDKIRARKKICWIHTDYSTINVNHALELPVWDSFDAIAGISESAAESFASVFPSLRSKIFYFENILSSSLVRAQALQGMPDGMDSCNGLINILSVGRLSTPKRFEQVPRICAFLRDSGLKFRWYIIGPGDDSEVRENIARHDVADYVKLLGLKANPYPYIAACDIYAQPSLYEGKSVTVREAQILCRPVIISDYPTAKAQIIDGTDGVIAPLDIDAFAESMASFMRDTARQRLLTEYLGSHEYGNDSEVEKIYDFIR